MKALQHLYLLLSVVLLLYFIDGTVACGCSAATRGGVEGESILDEDSHEDTHKAPTSNTDHEDNVVWEAITTARAGMVLVPGGAFRYLFYHNTSKHPC